MENPTKNGWWLGVPLWLRKPTYSGTISAGPLWIQTTLELLWQRWLPDPPPPLPHVAARRGRNAAGRLRARNMLAWSGDRFKLCFCTPNSMEHDHGFSESARRRALVPKVPLGIDPSTGEESAAHHRATLRARGQTGMAGQTVARQEGPQFKCRLRLGWGVGSVFFWLVVGNIFIFPYIGNNHPNWLSYFFRGVAQPPTSNQISGKAPVSFSCHRRMTVTRALDNWLCSRTAVPWLGLAMGDGSFEPWFRLGCKILVPFKKEGYSFFEFSQSMKVWGYQLIFRNPPDVFTVRTVQNSTMTSSSTGWNARGKLRLRWLCRNFGPCQMKLKGHFNREAMRKWIVSRWNGVPNLTKPMKQVLTRIEIQL